MCYFVFFICFLKIKMKELFEYIESFSTTKNKSTDGKPPMWFEIIASIFVSIIFGFGGTIVLGYLLFKIDIDASDEKGKQKTKILYAVGTVLSILLCAYLITDVINVHSEQEAKAKELQDAKKGK